VLLFDSIHVSHTKTINAKFVSFLNLYAVLNAVIKKLYNFDAWWTVWKHEKPAKECFDIQARGPQKSQAPGICPVCPMVNLALAAGSLYGLNY